MCMNKWIVVFQPFPDGSPVGPGGGWKRDANGSLPVTAIADTATSFVSAHRFSGPFESVLLGAALLCAIGATSVYFMRFFEHLLPTKVWSLAGMGFGCLQAIFTVAAIAHFHHDDGTPNTDMGQGLLAAAFSAGIEIFSILLMARDGMKNNFRNDQLRPAEQKYVLANAFIISVLILGGIGFRYLADMDFEDSFPFAIETALSLGYGNPTMPNPGSRIFLMAYFVLAACGFAFFFYGQHEMILERHEMKTKRKIEERRRRRQYVLDRVKAHHDKHHPGEEYELPTGFLDDRELARPGGIIVMLLRRFGLYFHLIKPTPFEQALMEARAARIAKKKRKRQKKFEEMKKRRHCDAQPTSGKELESNGRPDVVKFDDGHDGDEARGTDGEGDVTDSSDAVVEVLSGVIPGELLLDRNNLVGRVSGSGDTVDGGRYSHESRTAPVVGLSPQGEEVAVDKAGRRPRSPTREATDGSSLTLGETEGIMEEELDKIIENQRVRQFFLLVLGLWFGSAGVFQWTEPTWTYFDAIYFCFCTMATIGYGDVYPTTSYCWELWYLFVMTAVERENTKLLRMAAADDADSSPRPLPLPASASVSAVPPITTATTTTSNNDSAGEKRRVSRADDPGSSDRRSDRNNNNNNNSSTSSTSNNDRSPPQTQGPDGGGSKQRRRNPKRAWFSLAFKFHIFSFYSCIKALCMTTWEVSFEPFPADAPAGLGAGSHRTANGSLPVTSIADSALGTVTGLGSLAGVELAIVAVAALCSFAALLVYVMRFLEHLLSSRAWSI
ncbi:hypothetical protein DFJ73DRAFT_962434, partial [Zopfochytrium polystomum]